MKGLAILVFVGLAGLVCCRPDDDKYTTKYDHIDIDGIIKNEILFKNYVDCLLGEKKCTKDGELLKKILPDALNDHCSKCNESQRNASIKIIQALIKDHRPWWNKLQEKYDPQNTYVVKYADDLKKAGIVL